MGNYTWMLSPNTDVIKFALHKKQAWIIREYVRINAKIISWKWLNHTSSYNNRFRCEYIRDFETSSLINVSGFGRLHIYTARLFRLYPRFGRHQNKGSISVYAPHTKMQPLFWGQQQLEYNLNGHSVLEAIDENYRPTRPRLSIYYLQSMHVGRLQPSNYSISGSRKTCPCFAATSTTRWRGRTWPRAPPPSTTWWHRSRCRWSGDPSQQNGDEIMKAELWLWRRRKTRVRKRKKEGTMDRQTFSLLVVYSRERDLYLLCN